MSMTWNGVELDHAPHIRKRSWWEQVNDALEERAIPMILPCMGLAWIAGLQFA
jgi:hypothetical protein